MNQLSEDKIHDGGYYWVKWIGKNFQDPAFIVQCDDFMGGCYSMCGSDEVVRWHEIFIIKEVEPYL